MRLCLPLALLLLAGCFGQDPECGPSANPPAIEGDFAQSGAFSDVMSAATLSATASEVVVEYTAPDGARIRARYQVAP